MYWHFMQIVSSGKQDLTWYEISNPVSEKLEKASLIFLWSAEFF